MKLLDELKKYANAVSQGADPIEALHGHLCGPTCWHWDSLSEERKAELMKAPWNRASDAKRAARTD